jgi:hypothetical protein
MGVWQTGLSLDILITRAWLVRLLLMFDEQKSGHINFKFTNHGDESQTVSLRRYAKRFIW